MWLSLAWNDGLEMAVVGGYLVFPILGYLLSTQDFKKSYRIILYVAAFACAVFRYVMVLRLSQIDGVTNRTYFGYLGFYSVILAAGVFVFVKNSKIIDKIGQNEKFVKVIKTVSGCSFGVYLIHMILIGKFLFRFFPVECAERRFLGPVLVYVIAVAVIFVIKKIPIVNKIVP
jgi:surface polysaccharide O-acyltransferase-like enzyme